MPGTYDEGWLPGGAYDALRAQDFTRFSEAAALDLTARVPTCPDWDVTALCDHLAVVYQGRSYVIEHGEFKARDTFDARRDGTDPITWVTSWSNALDRALLDRPDDAPTATFMPGASTVHFWRRRMALETLVHRTDAEIATGEVSPMDDELSADGVNELLWFGTHPENDHHDGIAEASVVALTDGPRNWVATMTDGALTAVADRDPDARVRGSAPALLLALSGRDLEAIGPARFGVELPVVEGDVAAYERLLTRLGEF